MNDMIKLDPKIGKLDGQLMQLIQMKHGEQYLFQKVFLEIFLVCLKDTEIRRV